MPRHLPAFVILLSLTDVTAVAHAQTTAAGAEPLSGSVRLMGAAIQGVVRDEAGQAVSDVSILAMGATLTAVRSV